MSSETAQTPRRYVIRLAIQSRALDPADAVEQALEQMLRGGVENFTYSVEEVGTGTKCFVTPTTHRRSTEALYPTWGDDDVDQSIDHDDDEEYHGQFLG